MRIHRDPLYPLQKCTQNCLEANTSRVLGNCGSLSPPPPTYKYGQCRMIFKISLLIRSVTCTACTTPRCAKPTDNNGCSNITSLLALAKLAGFPLERDVKKQMATSVLKKTAIFVCLFLNILKFRKGWKTHHELVPTRPPEKVMSALKVGLSLADFPSLFFSICYGTVGSGNQLRRLSHDRNYSHPKYFWQALRTNNIGCGKEHPSSLGEMWLRHCSESPCEGPSKFL